MTFNSKLLSLSLSLAFLILGMGGAFYGRAAETGYVSSTLSTQLERKRFFAYTKRFAERVRLRPLTPQPELGNGLEAIEIGFERQSGHAIPRCYVALYLSSAVQIGEGLGSEVSVDPLEPARHFFLRPRGGGVDPRSLLSKNDATHLLDRQSAYFRQAGFTTADYVEGKRGARTSKAIQEYVAELLPEIRYVRISGCMPSSMIANSTEIDVALRRNGAPDYSKVIAQWRDEHFVKFRIPRSLLIEVGPGLESHERDVRRLIDARNRKRRQSVPKREK